MKRQSTAFDRFFIALVFVFLYAPILLLIVFSFNKGSSNVVWQGFSLHWYEELFSNRLIMHSVYTTLLVSLLATVIATVAGTFAAIGFHSLRRRKRLLLTTVNNIPMMNADIVTGVAMCLFFVAFFAGWKDFAVWFNGLGLFHLPERLTLGFPSLLIAHVTFDIPYIILAVSPKLRQMDGNLIDAAKDLGCTWMQAFWKVIIPEIKPGIVTGALTAFTMSVDDFVISYFTAGSSSSTLAMTIYGMTKKRVSPEINAISTLLFVTVLLLLVIINLREARLEQLELRRQHMPTLEEAADNFKHYKKPSPVPKLAGMAAVLALIVCCGSALAGNASQRVVNICSWGEYIDPSLLDRFEEETGIEVNYQTAESNESLYSLLKSGAGNYDLIIPSDYMVSQLIEEDMLAELNYENIPNFDLIDERFRNLPYDPENKYTVPYAWSTVGIIYNSAMVTDPITSWSTMFDPRYAGDVLMFRNSRDAMGLALLYLGHSLNTTDEGELEEAFELLADAKQQGVYQAFVMDEVFQKLEGGNAAIGAFYGGDFLTMQANNPDLRFVIPEEGSNWFVDAMCVLKDAPHQREAEEWINFMTDTEVNMRNMDHIGYASANREVLEGYPRYYEETYGEPLSRETLDIMAVPEDVLERCELYLNLAYETRVLYNDLWTRLGVQ